LPPGKTLDAFDFAAVPMATPGSKGRQSLVLRTARRWKMTPGAALGQALIEKGWRVLFTTTTDPVQKFQIARRELVLETAITKLDKYHLLILDDLAFVTKDQAETGVLFELSSARYERRSMLITANQPFGA
jgi:IstB-like ATP binding protein